jgi:hypothetical protein
MKLSHKNKQTTTTALRNRTNNKQAALSVLAGLAALSSAVPAYADDASKASSGDWQKPAWLTDLSLGVKESYDSNVYLSGTDVTPGYDIATKDKTSWVTTISPKIGVDLAKLLDKDSVLKTFALGYAPDFALYHDAQSETYAAHRFTTAVKAKADAVSFNLDNTFTYINGSENGLIYPAGSSSFVNGVVRERRDQWQDRTKASVKVDLGPVFIRPTVSLLYYDLGTTFSPATCNYVDRYDLNGGVDLGYNITKGTALTLGYRYGHQEQALLPLAIDATQVDASNDYHRFLLGAEGSPLKWLKVEASAGPELITYTANRPYKGGVVANGRIDNNPTDLYAEAAVTATLSPADSLTFKYKRWDWVSSTGKNAYRDTLCDATYRHKFTDSFQMELGLRAAQADYDPSSTRNDWQYTASIAAKYAMTKNLDLDLAYSYDRGINDQDGIPNSATRQFVRSITSVGATWKF